MKQLLQKNSQVLRFGVVGSLNTAIDFGLLLLLTSAGLPIIVANSLSSVSAFVFSFVANKKYTFKSTGANLKREIGFFVAVTLFGLLVIQNVLIWLLQPLVVALGIDSQSSLIMAKLFATAASLTWNYLLYSRVVFKQNA
jgi:putative flippase GtrA